MVSRFNRMSLVSFTFTIQLIMTALAFHVDQENMFGCHVNHNGTFSLVNETNVLYLLTLLPYPKPNLYERSFQPAWDGGPDILPAAELAVEHVNQDPHTLKGYNLKLINADGGCNVTIRAVTSFIEHVFKTGSDKTPLAGIIGPTCSESAIAISSITGRGGLALPNVHFASSAELGNRDRYPYTFGVVGSTFQIVEALFSFVRQTQLDQVAVLYDDSRAFLYTIKQELSNNGEFIVFLSAVYDTYFPLLSLRQSGAKFVTILSEITLARKILCIAYHEGMFAAKYQWIIVSYTYTEFREGNTSFHYDGRLYECNWAGTKDNNTLNLVLSHTLFICFWLTQMDITIPLVSGYTHYELQQQYIKKVYEHSSRCSFPIVPDVWASVTYDAVWALVQAINMTLTATDLKFVNNNIVINDNISEHFHNVNFKGASGNIHFDKETGFVTRVTDVIQIQDGKPITVGSIFNGRFTPHENTPPIFIDTSSQYDSVNPYLAAFFVLVEVALLVITAFVHTVSIVKKNHPSIKASSPMLNHFVFTSCYVTCLTAILYILVIKTLAIPEFVVVGNMCHAMWVWLVPIAITLNCGTLIAKTWRVYRIFVHFREPGPLISNRALGMIVVIQLGIDVIIGTSWSTISPIGLKVVEGGSFVNEKEETIIRRQCVFTNTTFWLVTLAAYKFLQIVALLVLCMLTMSVRNKRFSTVTLMAATYLHLLLAFVLIPVYAILWYTNAPIHVDFIVLCLFYSAKTFVSIVFVLAPPISPLFIHHSILTSCIKK